MSGRERARRPATWPRRAVGTVVLLALLAAGTAYHRLTDEDRLRAYAEAWLSDFTGGEVRIDEVTLEPFRGLNLRGVTVTTPASAGFDALHDGPAARTIFRSQSLFLRLRPFSLISGDLVVPQIVANDPELTLVHRLSDDARNWEVLLRRRRPMGRSGRPTWLPAIRMRHLRVVQYRLDEQGLVGGAPQVMWADVRPAADRTDVYELRVAKVFEDARDGALSSEEGRLTINLRSLALSGSVPAMSLDDLALLAPAGVLRRLDVLHVRGWVRAETLNVDRLTPPRAHLRLHDVSLSLPISPEEEPLSDEHRYVRLSGVGGTIDVTGRRARLDLAGAFRGAPLTVRGELTLGQEDFSAEGVGLDVKVTVAGAAFPLDDPDTDPAERRFVQRWFHLHEFVKDYDARGVADVEFQLRKTPGPGGEVQLVEGTFHPKGGSARYFRFPYRLHDVTGTVHLRPDRRIEIRDLAGVHGRGRVVINGLVDGYRSQGFDVTVQGRGVDLDEDLVRCLSPENRELIELFNARARMNIDAKLHRDAAEHGTPVEQNPWGSAVEVEFTDGSVRFARFPYPLAGVTGRMRIEGDGFEVKGVRGVRGGAAVVLDGKVLRAAGRPAVLDLTLDATAVPLDDVLRSALPAGARDLYERIAPAGTAEVSGRVFSAPGKDEPEYDLTVILHDAALSLPETRVRLADATGRVRIQREQIAVESLDARLEDSSIRMAARIGTQADAPARLQLASERLVLNEKLRADLPAGVQKMWDVVRPAGPVRFTLDYQSGPVQEAVGGRGEDPIGPQQVRRPGAATLPASSARAWESQVGGQQRPSSSGGSSAASRPVAAMQATPPAATYTAVIEALDCTAMPADFPLPLERLRGRCVVTPERVTFEKVGAQHGPMTFELAGRMDLAPDRLTGELSLAIRNLTFSEELRKAVPWRLRRLWNDVQPQGRADLLLEPLAFTRSADGLDWQARGTADLDGFAVDVGLPITAVKGRVTGSGGMREDVALDLALSLERADVDGRTVTDATLHMHRDHGEDRLRIEEFVGRFYGGDVIGNMEVTDRPGRPGYGLSISGRGISLEEFLNAKRPPAEPPVTAKGAIDGTLALSGRFGDPARTRGAGSVLVREAYLFKIPLVFSILQVVHGNVADDNAFHDARFSYAINGRELLINEIDLRGRSLSMVGAGRVRIPTQALDLTLLVGSPLKLPRIEVLTDLVEGVARELMEVRVQGTLERPVLHADVVRSVRKALDAVFNARLPGNEPDR